MRLISLTLTPGGNENGETVEIIINHKPGSFKSSYVRVVRLQDGWHRLTDCPADITKEERQEAFNHALIIIDMVFDITSGF